MRTLTAKIEQVDGAPSHIPASTLSHISAHIKIPNAFLQSSSTGLLPVTVSRFYLKKPRRSCVTIKEKTQNPTFWPLVTPRHAPRQYVCTIVFYSSLPLIWYAKWLSLYKMDFETFGAKSPAPWPCRPEVISKFRVCFSSPHSYGHRLWKFRDSSLNGLGALAWHYRWTYGGTDGRGYHNIPAFSSKSVGITKKRVLSHIHVTTAQISPGARSDHGLFTENGRPEKALIRLLECAGWSGPSKV